MADPDTIGLGDLGRREDYVGRQLRRWKKQWDASQQREIPAMDRAFDLLVERLPDQRYETIVHGDYRPGNVIFGSDSPDVVAVLDWEMATIGDPLMDLGTTLAYWTEAGDDPRWRAAGFGPTALPGIPTRRQLAERYARQTGFDVSNLTFYFCFGLFKLAVIVQQIYYRYHHGQTQRVGHAAGVDLLDQPFD